MRALGTILVLLIASGAADAQSLIRAQRYVGTLTKQADGSYIGSITDRAACHHAVVISPSWMMTLPYSPDPPCHDKAVPVPDSEQLSVTQTAGTSIAGTYKHVPDCSVYWASGAFQLTPAVKAGNFTFVLDGYRSIYHGNNSGACQ
jgi:hypothetical protein